MLPNLKILKSRVDSTENLITKILNNLDEMEDVNKSIIYQF